jgi:putative Mn2+ efflux pump MntP
MPVPKGITDNMNGTIWERNYQWRGRRAAIVGGIVMIALGLFIRVSIEQTAVSSRQ